MKTCSLCEKLQLVPGKIEDYGQLAHYHYLDGSIGPVVATFTLKPTSGLDLALRDRPVGVIVYVMPIPEMRLRSLAMCNFFSGFDRSTKLALVNTSIRRIGRVVIDPRFRGLGLASRLVRQTMPRLNVPIVEAVAVMGMVNPFFEKAGMTPFTAGMSATGAELIEAFRIAGVEREEFIDPPKVQQKLDTLSADQDRFVERSFRRFLKGHRSHRKMCPGLNRTRYILSRLAFTPVYYSWFNPEITVEL